jgi:cold shock protein
LGFLFVATIGLNLDCSLLSCLDHRLGIYGCFVVCGDSKLWVWDNGKLWFGMSAGIEGRAARRYQSLIVNLEISIMARGTVKWFNSQKGYGFILPAGGGGRDVFMHISAVERAGLSSLNEGQQIEFEIEENRGKTSAVNLRVR